MNEQSTENEIIEAIRSGQSDGIQQLYKRYYPMILNLIKLNGGKSQDAEDIFQEALISLISNIRKPGFTLTSKLSSYIYSICRNMWYYKIRGNKGTIIDTEVLNSVPDIDHLPEMETFEEKHKLIAQVFENLNKECQQILHEFYFLDRPLKDIGVEMNYTEGSIRVKKSRCMASLKKFVEDHPQYAQLFSYE
ncbi:MAG: sigma-70 family RNA polymerase sigma factor [Saprospiraceae bacterium]